MNGASLDRAVGALFALLRASLHGSAVETGFFSDMTPGDWERCWSLARRQGVSALAWDGISRLPESLLPPRDVKLAWALSVSAYEKKYRHYCKTACELSGFYASHGISMMQFKGIGLSTLYPVPCHREGGDIDIYTFSADRRKMDDVRANLLADELIREGGAEVEDKVSKKHSLFYFNGVPFENHKTFLNVETYRSAEPVEKILRSVMDPHPAAVAGGGELLTPSPLFNLLFVAFHALQHYGNGMSLHHLCDWAVLIDRYGLDLPSGIGKPFMKFINALTYSCNLYLGTSVPIRGAEDTAIGMLNEILFPEYPHNVPTSVSGPGIIVFKAKRMIHLHRIRNRFLPHPFAKVLWDSAIRHIQRPDTIFMR